MNTEQQLRDAIINDALTAGPPANSWSYDPVRAQVNNDGPLPPPPPPVVEECDDDEEWDDDEPMAWGAV